MVEAEKSTGLRRGRPPKKKRKTYVRRGQGPIVAMKLEKEKCPSGIHVLFAKHRLEFYQLTGIRIPDDLSWDAASPTRRIETILETLARLKEPDKHET